MPDLFEMVRRDGGTALAYPIHDYWVDLGQNDDFEHANKEFAARF